MASAGPASEEIERSLKVERDAAELQIARYRFWFFLVVVSTSVIPVIGSRISHQAPPPVWASVLLFGTCVAYSAALFAWIKRRGAKSALIYTALVLDLLAIASPGVVFPLVQPEQREQIASFGPYLAPTGLLLVLFVNVLRMNGRASILGAIVAVPILWAVIVPNHGVHPPLVMSSVAILFTGAVGVAAARRSRRSLDTFSRLQLLRRFLPVTAVDRVLREDPDAALALGGRSRIVTLLSADLRGFTAMSESLPPEQVVAQLNAYHGAMVEQIDRHEGVLDKFIGDGLLAVFGFAAEGRDEAPDAGARQALACARAMLGALTTLNAERARHQLPPLAMGIAVHTGPVVAGNIGAPGKRLEFTVIGDTVNSVSRLEGMTKDLGRPLLISNAAVERLGDLAGLEQLPPFTLRGRKDPFVAYVAA